MTFIRHEIAEGVTWMKQEFRAVESELVSISESIWQDPRSFAAGFLTSVGKEISFGTLPLNEPDDPDAAYYAGRTLGDITGVVGGTIVTEVGGALEGGGFVLDATGIGAVIGVPANVAGAAMIAGGASIGAISSANFANDTNQMFAKVHEDTDSASGGNEGTGEGSQVRNAHLAGTAHPVTGVPFDNDGFPVFNSKFDHELPENLYTASDPEQFKMQMRRYSNT